MSESRKAHVVDGFTVVRMVKHHAGTDASAPPVTPPPKRERPPDSEARKTHIGHTIQPTRHAVRCYHCGYEFQLTVRVQNTYCPKCRSILDLVNYTIDGEWAESLRTAGSVRITPQGMVRAGKIMANDILLEGRLEGGTLDAYGLLDVSAGAAFTEEAIAARDLRVGPGAEATFRRKVRFHHVEVAGTLKANVEATGRVVVKAGGLLRGRLRGPHLAVEEGGGLVAHLKIESGGEPE